MEALQSSRPLHPIVSLLSAVIILSAGIFNAKNPLFPAYILAVMVLYAAFGLGRALLKSLAFLIPAAALFALFSLLFSRSAHTAVQMAGRVALIGLSALPMITLPPINLTRCLAELGLPRALTLGMLIAIRFVPVVGAEVGRVREALRTRGVRDSFYRAFVIPVMIRLFTISDTMALSLETRAFSTGPEPVSVYNPVRFCLRDFLYSAAAAALVAGWAVII
jgi:energy-coupling factor transport system permease protein